MSLHIAQKAKAGDDRKKLLSYNKPPVYDDGRTKQSFKDQCDINKMLDKAQVTGSLSHLLKYPEAIYQEFNGDFDLLTAHERISRATEIFDELPSEMRKDFNNNPLDFVRWAGDPANAGKLIEKYPQIAAPGRYFPNPVQRGGQGAGAATAPPAGGAETPPEAAPPAVEPPGGGAAD